MNPIWFALGGWLTGGAMGALINNSLTNRRNKRQPVQFSKQVFDIFRKNQKFENIRARLLVRDGPADDAPEKAVDNLSMAKFAFTNKGNADIAEFTLGLTFKGTNRVMDMRMSEPDRHHKMTVSFPDAVDANFVNKPDYTLKPFNRGDTYSVDIYFTYDETQGPIELSTTHAVNFMDMSPIPFMDGGLYLAPTPRWVWLAIKIYFILTIVIALLVIFSSSFRNFLENTIGIPPLPIT